ncbi:MAG: hypothetical protein ACYC7I_06260 [Gammaproteobacteria bacterium]
MLELQKMFIDYEHKNGLNLQDYYSPSEKHPLAGFREEYYTLAKDLVDLAHTEVGSRR